MGSASGSGNSVPRKPVTKVYSPYTRSRVTPSRALQSLVGEISAYRSHIRTIYSTEFRNAHSGAALGLFWNYVLPVIPITVYILLVNLRVFPVIEGLEPAVYIAFNVTLWMLLTGLITQPMQVIKQKNQHAMRTAMPMSSLIASAFAQLCLDTLIRLGLVLVLICVFRHWPAIIAPLALLPLLAAMIFCFSLGLLLSIFNVIYQDVEQVVRILLQYGIFLSGVIFPVSSLGPLAVLETTNPFNVFIGATRDLTFRGTYAHMEALAIWSLVGIILLLFSVRFFYVMEHKIREIV